MKNSEEVYEEIKTKIEAQNLICDEINKKIMEFEDLLKQSSLGRVEYTVCQKWGTNIFYVYWCPNIKRLMAFTEYADRPLLEHKKQERMEFFKHWDIFLKTINEVL
jgi:hypothetical protein